MKNKLLIVSAFLFGTILSFSQTYNYSISQVSVNGSTEVYEILIYADIASSSDIEVNGMQVNVSLEPGEFTNLMLLADGDVYGNFNSRGFRLFVAMLYCIFNYRNKQQRRNLF